MPTVVALSVFANVHLVATSAMMGLIWFIQLVHYPLFRSVGPEVFVGYEQQHTRRTSWVVGPLMGIETASALALAVAPPDGVGRLLPSLGLVLLAVIHASTILLQVPMHRALSEAYDEAAVKRLVDTNWIRTIGWTARTLLAAVIVANLIDG